MRRASLLLLPVGPVSVALLRFLLPYDTADGSLAAVTAVYAHPGRESVVLWLGLIAVLTLLPGVMAVASILPAGPLTAWAVGLSISGYLCLGPVLAQDYVLAAGVHAHTDPHLLAAQLDALHPSYVIATAIFVVGHVMGTVLLGLALLRSRRIPAWAAWTIAVSQPIHFVAAAILGSPLLDLIAWSMTALGMTVIARTLLARPTSDKPVMVAA